MLGLGKIPLLSKDRTESDPIIIAGGPCAYNPEPIADFIDIFSIGEGEEALLELASLINDCKKQGISREETLYKASMLDGFYVPSLYEVTYNSDGTLASFTPKKDGVPAIVRKRIISDLDKVCFPRKCAVPFLETVHDRVMLEVFRGCIRGCRFCQAGMVYRPVREKSADVLNHQAKALYNSTGYEEISLASLSISDYTALEPLCDKLLNWTDDNMVSLSLPSLRVDSFSKDLMRRIESVRSSSLTFAPEAGTQRLRDVINKNVREEEVMRAVNVAFDARKSSVKLYFMNGLPTETLEDIEGIATLAEHVVDAYYQNPNRNRARPVQVTVSVSCFIPKPFTPFQWEAQDTMEMLAEKQEYLKSKIKNKHIRYVHHDAKVSRIEAVLARGDRRLGDALELACREGFCFDAWHEYFDYDKWLSVFERTGVDPAFYANRKFGNDEVLPWDIIDCGVSKEFFLREQAKAYGETTTPNCREHCSACGANKLGGVRAVCPGCKEMAQTEIQEHLPQKQDKSVWEPVEGSRIVRIKFRKVGDLQYISHLDLQRTVARVLVRANIPMWYTQGFNPHAKVVFGLPLSVGTQSECEFIDLRVDRNIPCEEVKNLLNRELTEEMQVLDAYEPTTKFADISWARYEIDLNFAGANAETAEKLNSLFTTSPLLVMKKSKSGEREVDLTQMIRAFDAVCTEDGNIAITAILRAGNTENLNPEMLIGVAKERLGILSGDPTQETYSILRTNVYTDDGVTEFK